VQVNRGATEQTGARIVEGRQRQEQALQLRLSGASFAAIAEQLGYADRASAYNAVTSALDRVIVEQRPAAVRGELSAVDRVLRIGEQRARLLGFNAPTKIDTTHAGAAELQAALHALQEEIGLSIRAEIEEEMGQVSGKATSVPVLPTGVPRGN
jgi:hypothetical protein